MILTVVTATGRRERLELAQAQLTEAALRAAVVRQLGLAPPAAAQLRLVHGGQPLADDEAVSRLQDGGELQEACVAEIVCRHGAATPALQLPAHTAAPTVHWIVSNRLNSSC